MNRTLKSTLFVSLTAFALMGAASTDRAADDMGDMKMGDSKAAQEKPGKEMTKKPAKKGAEKVEIAVTDKGFEPDKVEVTKGQPVELVFTRKTDQTCIKEVILETGAKKVQKPLPLNKPVTIKTKFTKAGDLKYACSMNMFSGTVKVQ